MFGKSLIAASLTLLGLLVTADVSRAQPSFPQGNGSIGGSRSYGTDTYRGYYSAPSVATPAATYESFYSPEAQRSGWEKRSDGWFYYWGQGQVIGAYDPDSEAWYNYNPVAGWGRPTRAPWKHR